jgi:hypothetical protein
MGIEVVVLGRGGASVEALKWLLEGSEFTVLGGRAAPQASEGGCAEGAAPWSVAYRARELLNRVAMLAQCLQLPDVTDAEWRQWPREIADANRQLDALYAGGLGRNFIGESARSCRRPASASA